MERMENAVPTAVPSVQAVAGARPVSASAAVHRRWFPDPPDGVIRCECGEPFNGFLAWSKHLMETAQ